VSPYAKKRFLAPDAEPLSDANRLAESLYKIPVLLTTWTRCGKPRCRCREGHLHGPYHVLHWRDGAIQRRRYVRAADVPAVRAILEQRRAERAMERLAFTLSLQSWRDLSRWVAEYEAALRGERTEL
jgi:hypothetical protein